MAELVVREMDKPFRIKIKNNIQGYSIRRSSQLLLLHALILVVLQLFDVFLHPHPRMTTSRDHGVEKCGRYSLA